jgi:DNA repair exonuclease SbcCD nuclease subunit
MKRNPTQFGLINDIHWSQAGTDYANVLPDIIESLNGHNLPFVIVNGDSFHDDASDVTAFLAEMNKLNCPWHWVWGNHDAVVRVDLETALTAAGVEHTLPRMITLSGHNIFLIDSSETSADMSAAITYLQTELAAHTEPAIIVTHYSLIGTQAHIMEDKEDFMAALKPFQNVKAIICAHDHITSSELMEKGILVIQGKSAGGSSSVGKGYKIIKLY